jgi:DNA-binding CsgD family transcriptional regulator
MAATSPRSGTGTDSAGFNRDGDLPDAAPTPMLAAAADALGCALFLLAADATLLHANQAGLALLARGLWLRLDTLPDRQRVVASGTVAARQFDQALAAAAAGQRQDVDLPPTLHPARAVMSAQPLSPGANGSFRPVLLMLSAGAGEPGAWLDLSAYAEAHGLTAAEARVLARLARGDSASTAAAALGLGVSTVRTQISSLRRKTGHRSQAALALELSALPPLRASTKPRPG